MIVKSVIASIIAGIILAIAIPLFIKYRNLWDPNRFSKKVGLKMFALRIDFDSIPMNTFEKLIDGAKKDDEILIVGRTLRWLTEKQDKIMDGLEKGLNFKLLILNPKKVRDKSIDLRPLQLRDDRVIDRDLQTSVDQLISICNESVNKSHKGFFEVKTCDFVIFNSIISYTPNRNGISRKSKIILDFSFSDAQSTDKYVQYYEWEPRHVKYPFCDKLYRFYKGIYDQCEIYIQYRERRLYHGKEFIREDIEALTQEYSESEEIRSNGPINILQTMANSLKTIKRGSQFIHPPISVQLELTNKCGDVKCRHCMRHTWPADREMSFDTIKSILDDLARLRVKSITFSGGEPTMRPDMAEILRYAHSEHSLNIGVLTNGLGMSTEMADELARHSDWVRISIDGSCAEVYEKIRGKNVGWEKVIDSIKKLEEAKRRNQGKNFRIGLCYSIQKLNIDDVSKMVNFVAGLNLQNQDRTLTFKFVHGSDSFLCTSQQLSEFRMNILSREEPIWDRLTNLRYLRKFMEIYSNAQDIAEGLPLRTYYRENRIRCFAPYLFSLIDAYGDVYPCCFLYYDNESYELFESERRKHKIGTISDSNPFSKIWLCAEYEKIREELKIIDRFPKCKECTRHYLHNSFLTKLFEKYDFYTGGTDNQERNIFEEVLSEYPSRVIWL